MNLTFLHKYFIPSSILDIGASVGDFAQQSKMTFPNAYFYLIEGNPNCEERLKNTGCDYFIGLLSDSEKTVTFYMDKSDPTSTGNSIYRENTHHFSDDNVLEISMTTKTLDSVVDGKQFDFIKLDVQGSELDIIRGGMNTVRNTKGVLMEVSVTEYNHGAPLQDEVIEFMDSIGFDMVDEVDTHANSDGWIFQRDLFFLNKNSYESIV